MSRHGTDTEPRYATLDGQTNTAGEAVEQNDLARQKQMVRALCAGLRARNRNVRLCETHISFVLLTGQYAYKIKKAVKLPFLDFSTLALRRLFCNEELRLNRRLAPALYLDVVPITGSRTQPAIDGAGPILEYAVRMHEFARESLLCNVVERDALTPAHLDALARRVADFHASARRAAPDSLHGTPERVLEVALANFIEIEPLVTETSHLSTLKALKSWTRDEYESVFKSLERRYRSGAIRECHGDLHLGNIALVDDEITIFDCIEFNESMRWTDTMSEVAFTAMDLEYRKRSDLAYRYLNAYCERSGDYDGASVLHFYLVYRSMVRAKVACLRAAQMPDGEDAPSRKEFSCHLRLALTYTTSRCPAVVLMHGASGTGKSTLSQLLVERTGALRIRTDVERKRLAGLTADARSGSTPGGGIYSVEDTRRTYNHVLRCADAVVEAAFPAIVDGAFLQAWQRDAFRKLAKLRQVPFLIVDCIASEATLRARVAGRARAGTDASEADLAVLAQQLQSAQPLSDDELRSTVVFDTEMSFAYSMNAVQEIANHIRPNTSSHFLDR